MKIKYLISGRIPHDSMDVNMCRIFMCCPMAKRHFWEGGYSFM